MSAKLTLKSTTTTSLNDRFSRLMKNRPDEITRSMVDSGSLRPGSERNRKLAEELERRSGADIRRRPVTHRIGDIGQGGARSFAAALPTRSSTIAGRVGKRPARPTMTTRIGQTNGSSVQATKALKKAQTMLRETERELAILKRQKPGKDNQKIVRRGGMAKKMPGRGGGVANRSTRGTRGVGRGTGRGAARGAGRGAPRGGGKPKSQAALDAELDGYMLGTKGGLDKQMEDYMSNTKNGLDKQMEDYMAQKNSV